MTSGNTPAELIERLANLEKRVEKLEQENRTLMQRSFSKYAGRP